MKMKNKIIIFSSVFLLLLSGIISFFVVSSNNKKKENDDKERLAKNEEYIIAFQDNSTEEERIAILKQIIKDRDSYTGNNEEVIKSYNSYITEMKERFTNGYDVLIESYQYRSQVEELTVESCEEYIAVLNELKDTINSQKDFVLEDNNELYNSYIEKIDKLVSSFESMIEELDKEEETTEEITTEEPTTEETTEDSAITHTTEEPSAQAPATTQAPVVTEAPATEAPSSNNDIPGPASNLFSSGRPYSWSSWTYEDGTTITTYCDNYGWAYYEDGSYAGYNVMELY